MPTTHANPAIIVTTTSPESLRPRPDPTYVHPTRKTWPPCSAKALGVCVCLIIISLGWDRAAWLAVSEQGTPRFEWLEKFASPERLWSAFTSAFSFAPAAITDLLAALPYAIAYHFGRIWPWLIISAFLVFRNWGTADAFRVKRGLRLGVFVFLTPAAAGLIAECIKLLGRRLRPEASDGFYAFRPFTGSPLSPRFYDMTNLGLTSSHASLAIAAALAAGLVFPRLRWILLIIAIATCLSRLLVGAHYLSDVVAGALIGVLAFRLIYAWDARNNAGVPIDADAALSR